MHLMIPFASVMSDSGLHTLRDLTLPNLSKLFARLTPTRRTGTDEYTLNTPHERALAEAFGWSGDDGCLPWAAHTAAVDGVDTGTAAWGQLTPVHWHVGADHVSLADPHALFLSAQASHTLFEAVKPLFESEGWSLAWGSPGRWFAAHDSLDNLPSASLDRVVGRNIDLWMPTHPQARLLRRLQNEVQMLLYQHPLNDERVGLGALPVNSFWLSGCGRAQPVPENPDLMVDHRLRQPALAGDWAGWAEAWRALDAGPLAEAAERARQDQPVTLTLSGERFAQRLELQPQPLWTRVRRQFSAPAPYPLLAAL